MAAAVVSAINGALHIFTSKGPHKKRARSALNRAASATSTWGLAIRPVHQLARSEPFVACSLQHL